MRLTGDGGSDSIVAIRFRVGRWIMGGYQMRVKETTAPNSEWRTYRPDPTLIQKIRLAMANFVAGGRLA